VSASGVDIWNASDQFRFVYQQITGDVDVVARVDSFSAADPWSKIGVMVRADLSASSAHAMALLTGANGVNLTWRPQSGAAATSIHGPIVSAPQWVKLTKTGNTLTAYAAADGASWQNMGSTTITLGTTVYAGLAITSHNPGVLASAVVSNVSITPRGLPSGQQTSDIGSPAIAGSTSYANGTYTITGAGIDIQGSSDQFRFLYQQISGDVDVVARVNSIQNVSTWAKAGVMIRETLSANSRNAMALMSAGRGYSYQWRADTGGSTSYMRTNGSAPAWVRLIRTGTKFEAFRSTNGTSWTSMGSQTISMGSNVYVGLAVTSHNASAATTAVIDQLKIAAASTSANQPPSVTLTSPSAGTFQASTNITVSATASDPENRLSRVDFFANQTKIGSDSAAPYTMSWPSVAAGTYSLTAQAVDLDGGTATSPAVTIVVSTSSPSAPKTLVFQKSADHATLVTSYRFDIFSSSANPATATPLRSVNLGKPTPAANGDITIDESSVLTALAAGTYQATVSAIGAAGESRSAPVTFVR
jgi:hypothetical protein